MTEETSTRVQIAALIYSMTNSVLFGAGLVLVLAAPVLNADAGFWISVVVGASLILSGPIAWWMAPRLRARYWKRRSVANDPPSRFVIEVAGRAVARARPGMTANFRRDQRALRRSRTTTSMRAIS